MSRNIALDLLAALGVNVHYFKAGRSAHHTKKGPGRRHLNGKPKEKKQ